MIWILAFLLETVWALVATSEVLALTKRRVVRAVVISGFNSLCSVVLIKLVDLYGLQLVVPVVLGNMTGTLAALVLEPRVGRLSRWVGGLWR